MNIFRNKNRNYKTRAFTEMRTQFQFIEMVRFAWIWRFFGYIKKAPWPYRNIVYLEQHNEGKQIDAHSK